MRTVRTIAEVRDALPQAGAGLVPTMGALHAGHLALFDAARAECDFVAASIFVNPAQFAPGEDFDRYPRNEEADVKVAEAAGVDLLFTPSVEEMYPAGFETWVEVENLGRILEGAFRPDHFRGVATVCLKLFNIVRPERAYFGQKDAQQFAVLKRMVRDLDLDLEIRVVATVRDPDGLAVSSRNVYLSAADRRRALALPRALAAGEAAHRTGRDPVAAARASMDGLDVDYIEAVELDGQIVLEAAVRIGDTRLIDNVVLEGER
jgi:pantoate--beta-alanine ligase